MDSPIAAFLAWYASLPRQHRQFIAEFVSAFTPGFEAVEDSDDKVDAFTRCVRRHQEDKFKGVGMALILRSTIDFFFIRNQGTTAAWDDRRRFLTRAKEYFAAKGLNEMVGKTDQYLRETQFSESLGVASAEKWIELVRTDFADDYIDAWWRVDRQQP